MKQGIQYKEYSPSASLVPYIHRFWTVESETYLPSCELSPVQTCIPLGLIEWIIQLDGDKMEGLNEAGWYRYPRDFFVGITDRPSKWRMRAYNRTVGISFKPEGMMKIFGFPPKEITNAQISSDAILSKTDLRIPEQLYNIRNIKEQLFLLESFLHNRITHSATRDENFINALSQVRLQSDHFTRQNLFESFFLSERQIQRIFREKIGMSPKAYQKITRFGRLFGALQSGSTPDWTDMAYKMGYSDQAHMIRDFRLYTDSSPSIFDNYPVQITLI